MADSFLSKFITFLLNSAGIAIPNQSQTSFLTTLKYYLLTAYWLIFISQISALKDCEAIYQITVTLAFIFSGIFLNISTLVLHMKKTHIITILNMVKTEIPRIMEKHPTIPTSNEKFKKFFLTYGIAYFIIYAFATMSPIIFLPISGTKLGDLNTLLIPSGFPWKYDSPLKYAATIGLQFLWLFPLSIPCLLNLTFVVYFLIEVRIQFDILCADVTKLKEYSSREQRTDENINRFFQECVQHHQLILKFVDNFCACYNWVFTADLLYSLANLSLLLYGIVLGERTISALMQQFSSFVLVFSFLFLYCYIGETLETANNRFKCCIYDIEWFKQSVKFKRTFSLFMCIIQRNINLKAGSNGIASYELFFSVVKLAYSYFNVLTSTFSR